MTKFLPVGLSALFLMGGAYGTQTGLLVHASADAPAAASAHSRPARYKSTPYTFARQFGKSRALKDPNSLAYTPTMHLLITDKDKNRVLEFTKKGRLIRSFGRFGGRPGEFRHIGEIAADSSGRIFVTDGQPGRVEVFTPKGKFLYQFGTKGAGRFGQATSIAISRQHRVFVCDFKSKQIKVYNARGHYLYAIQSPGHETGTFMGLSSLTFSREGNVFVTDTQGPMQIDEFTPQGKFLRAWKERHFNAPDSLAFDARGHLLMTEDNAHLKTDNGQETVGAVLEYTGDGKYLGQFGKTGPGAVSIPGDIAVDSTGTVAVLDFGHNRVVTFQISDNKR